MSTFICTSCRASIRQMSRGRAFHLSSTYSPSLRSVEPSMRPSQRFPKCTPIRMYSHVAKSSAPEDPLVQWTPYKDEPEDSQHTVYKSPVLEDYLDEYTEFEPESEDNQSTSYHPYESSKPNFDIAALLSTPTWSVEEHFKTPDEQQELNKQEITSQKLHHLLRLCALPQPQSKEEEQKMLDTLRAQLNFVKEIQRVDTDGIEPLQSIRDETEEGIADNAITLKKLQDHLTTKEDIIGTSKRPRRRRNEPVNTEGEEDWDCLSTAGEKIVTAGGAYFVVRSGKGPTKPFNGVTNSGKGDPIASFSGREPSD
ncbi:hypothetical protein B0J14DRAFT_575054 [Halenospora varia]|nr:hypothetical protein B0J14DRAFT_575054 [Halenospora varia]